MSNSERRYSTVVVADGRRVLVPVTFDPDSAWGERREHLVAGSVNGMAVRAAIEPLGDGYGIILGPAWRRDCGLAPGDAVDVVLAPEGPQRSDLADDLRVALDATPEAGEFFDSLAHFYRNAYLKWIDATKRRPEQREQRIKDVVALLEVGVKERPKPTSGR